MMRRAATGPIVSTLYLLSSLVACDSSEERPEVRQATFEVCGDLEAYPAPSQGAGASVAAIEQIRSKRGSVELLETSEGRRCVFRLVDQDARSWVFYAPECLAVYDTELARMTEERWGPTCLRTRDVFTVELHDQPLAPAPYSPHR